MTHSDPGPQVLGDGVQQGVHQPGLAAVQGLQPVQAHVGGSQFRFLHPVADSLEGLQDPPENPPVVGLVRLQDRPADLAGEGLLRGHPRRDALGGREVVDDQHPALGAQGDHDGQLSQVGMPPHLQLGPEVGDEHAGDTPVCSIGVRSGGFPVHRSSSLR